MSGAGSFERFARDPAAWADPALVAPLIAPGLQPAVAARLLRGRTAARASALLAAEVGDLHKGALAAIDWRLLAGPPALLLEAGTQAGCVWHATRVRALVLRDRVAALVGRFGEPARAAALRHASPAEAEAGGDLLDDIARDAERCIASWIAELPPPAAARMRLVRPAAPPPADAPRRAALVRRLAGEIAE